MNESVNVGLNTFLDTLAKVPSGRVYFGVWLVSTISRVEKVQQH